MSQPGPLWTQKVEERGICLELWVAGLGKHKKGTALHSVMEGSGFPYHWIGITPPWPWLLKGTAHL